MKSLNEVGCDTLITIKVKTRQASDMILLEDGEVYVYVKDPPVKNKANKTIINLLRKHFKNNVILEYGQNSTIKVLRICNLNSNQVIEILQRKKEEEK
ncbi:MAG: DUF167 domain-containing protein [Candidatus Hodarchaeales archaeon]|jgi:uncharacterized protein (TIGR00251 family)